jgi:hypothetical protein
MSRSTRPDDFDEDYLDSYQMILYCMPVYLQVFYTKTREADFRCIPQSASIEQASILTVDMIISAENFVFLHVFPDTMSILGYGLLKTTRLGEPSLARYLNLIPTA